MVVGTVHLGNNWACMIWGWGALRFTRLDGSKWAATHSRLWSTNHGHLMVGISPLVPLIQKSTSLISGIHSLMIEWGYGTMHSALWSVLWMHIFIFKVQTLYLFCSTWYPYENVLGCQILHFLEFFVLFFLIGTKSLHLKILDHLKVVIFYLCKKIVNKF